MKYVIVKQMATGEEFPIMFPDTMKHDTFRQTDPRYTTIVSAGFCHKEVLSGLWVTQGESLSLRIASRPLDAALLMTYYK